MAGDSTKGPAPNEATSADNDAARKVSANTAENGGDAPEDTDTPVFGTGEGTFGTPTGAPSWLGNAAVYNPNPLLGIISTNASGRVCFSNKPFCGRNSGASHWAGAGSATPAYTDAAKVTGRVVEAQAQLASIRTLPLNGKLVDVLNYAAEKAGVKVVVNSGGQCPCGCGGPRIGSTRHDNGMAADLTLVRTVNGREETVNFDDVSGGGRAVFEKFVEAARAAGATGIGAGEGYMGPQHMHVGFGSEATWGAGGCSSAAPEWLDAAYAKGYANRVNLVPPATMRAEQSAAVAAQTPEAPKAGTTKTVEASKPAIKAGAGFAVGV